MTKEQQIEEAAKFFIELYHEDIEAGESVLHAVHEWWGLNFEQYPPLTDEDEDFEAIKAAVAAKLPEPDDIYPIQRLDFTKKFALVTYQRAVLENYDHQVVFEADDITDIEKYDEDHDISIIDVVTKQNGFIIRAY